MPIILHESEGLKIVKNDKNKFCVVTLHYTADPRKRTEEWKREAESGMTPAQWAKEYEIDYTALYGQKVFPELATNKARIVIHPPYPEFPDFQTCWGGFDYGGRSPASFHVYTICDGATYAIWELYEPCGNVADFAKKMQECPYWNRIKYIAADPSIWWKNQQAKQGALTSIYELFIENKIYKFLQGVTDEPAWIAQMRQHWTDPDDPTFKIFDCCPMMVKEFEEAVYASTSDKALMTQNLRENILDKNNHSLDDCKYYMNSKPRLAKERTKGIKPFIKKWLH